MSCSHQEKTRKSQETPDGQDKIENIYDVKTASQHSGFHNEERHTSPKPRPTKIGRVGGSALFGLLGRWFFWVVVGVRLGGVGGVSVGPVSEPIYVDFAGDSYHCPSGCPVGALDNRSCEAMAFLANHSGSGSRSPRRDVSRLHVNIVPKGVFRQPFCSSSLVFETELLESMLGLPLRTRTAVFTASSPEQSVPRVREPPVEQLSSFLWTWLSCAKSRTCVSKS